MRFVRSRIAVKHFKFKERVKRRLHKNPRSSFAWAPHVTSTVHPSSILRAPDEQQRHIEYQKFVDDLKKVQARWRRVKMVLGDS